jgi:hypothetical protein
LRVSHIDLIVPLGDLIADVGYATAAIPSWVMTKGQTPDSIFQYLLHPRLIDSDCDFHSASFIFCSHHNRMFLSLNDSVSFVGAILIIAW